MSVTRPSFDFVPNMFSSRGVIEVGMAILKLPMRRPESQISGFPYFVISVFPACQDDRFRSFLPWSGGWVRPSYFEEMSIGQQPRRWFCRRWHFARREQDTKLQGQPELQEGVQGLRRIAGDYHDGSPQGGLRPLQEEAPKEMTIAACQLRAQR